MKKLFEFLVSYVFIRVQPFGAKELHDAHLASLAPVRAVRGPSDVGVVVRCVFSGGGFWPGGEGDVLCL